MRRTNISLLITHRLYRLRLFLFRHSLSKFRWQDRALVDSFTHQPRCYQCAQQSDYLFPDARCKDCTRQTVEDVVGEEHSGQGT